FACQGCDSYFTPDYPALAPGAHATRRFLDTAARLIRFSDIANVAAFYRLPESTLARWYYAHVERQQQASPQAQPIRSRTLDDWLGLIANYFVSRSSNGRTEGYNHGLRSILWRAFGMGNFQHFRLRALDRFGKPAAA